MDRMRACGVCDVGSIPTEGTNTIKVPMFLLFFQMGVHASLLQKHF